MRALSLLDTFACMLVRFACMLDKDCFEHLDSENTPCCSKAGKVERERSDFDRAFLNEPTSIKQNVNGTSKKENKYVLKLCPDRIPPSSPAHLAHFKPASPFVSPRSHLHLGHDRLVLCSELGVGETSRLKIPLRLYELHGELLERASLLLGAIVLGLVESTFVGGSGLGDAPPGWDEEGGCRW